MTSLPKPWQRALSLDYPTATITGTGKSYPYVDSKGVVSGGSIKGDLGSHYKKTRQMQVDVVGICFQGSKVIGHGNTFLKTPLEPGGTAGVSMNAAFSGSGQADRCDLYGYLPTPGGNRSAAMWLDES